MAAQSMLLIATMFQRQRVAKSSAHLVQKTQFSLSSPPTQNGVCVCVYVINMFFLQDRSITTVQAPRGSHASALRCPSRRKPRCSLVSSARCLFNITIRQIGLTVLHKTTIQPQVAVAASGSALPCEEANE